MLQLAVKIVTYGFDLFILLTYMKYIMGERNKNISNIIFIASYFLLELLLYLNEYLTSSMNNKTGFLLTAAVSFFTTLGLTFLYESNFRIRLFTAISFQILSLFGEYAFTSFMLLVRPEMFLHITPALNTPMNLGSKVFLFLFTLIIGILFRKSFYFPNKIHYLLFFTTPFVSLVIMLFTPLENISQSNNQTFFLSIYLCLAILNITNYILLYINYQQTFDMFQLRQMKRLSRYQQEKYIQISSAYKANRSLMHDTKKHYFMIKKYLEKKEYQKLDAYMDISISDIENTFSEINTGNLVIDSFVSNYKNICYENGIEFSSDLSVDPSRIPINNYDLCIILGNILDNAFNACKNNITAKNHIELIITINDNDIFYIHEQNSYHHTANIASGKKLREEAAFSEHGYGLYNIRKIIEEHHGVFNTYSGDLFINEIVIPITNHEMRILPPTGKSFAK